MKRKILTCIFLFVVILPSSLFAARRFAGYEKGSYKISIRIPFELPVAYWVKGNETTGLNNWYVWNQIGYNNNIEFGIEIGYEYFMNSKLSLGGLIGYHFSYMRSNSLISRVPFAFRMSYYPYTDNNFDIPIILGVGGAYENTKGYSMVTMHLSLETGFSWYWNDNWGVGLRTGLHLIPEFLSGRPDQTNLTFFIPIVAEVTFRR